MSEARYDVFRYLAASEHADLYRAIMRQFMAAKERFIVHLRAEEVQDALGERDLAPQLMQLRDWGNLRADPDTSRVTSVEDFNRARFVYQLTAAGEKAEIALAEFDRSFDQAGALQSWALEEIVVQLSALIELAGVGAAAATGSVAPPIDTAKARASLAALTQTFTGLAQNAQLFSGDLQRTLDLRGIDTAAFLAYKDRLIGYLERFIQDLLIRGGEIAELLERLGQDATERLLLAVAEHEARDAAPDTDGAAGATAIALERWRERFTGFRQWFVSGAGPSQAMQLRQMARAAIPDLVDTVRRLADRRAGRSDRAADFRTLALWFAEAPDDDARHRLARVAFGLAPARHLAADDEFDERPPVPASTSWRDAPPVVISPRLRATGSYERRGKPTSVRDRAADRRAIELAVEAGRLAADALRAQIETAEPVPIGEYPITDPAARALLLALLGDALARRATPGEHIRAPSLDGAWEVEVWPDAPVGRGARSTLRQPDGQLTGPAHRIRIREAS